MKRRELFGAAVGLMVAPTPATDCYEFVTRQLKRRGVQVAPGEDGQILIWECEIGAAWKTVDVT